MMTPNEVRLIVLNTIKEVTKAAGEQFRQQSHFRRLETQEEITERICDNLIKKLEVPKFIPRKEADGSLTDEEKEHLSKIRVEFDNWPEWEKAAGVEWENNYKRILENLMED